MKQIPKPELKSATLMTPLEMNKVPFSKDRTVLTPDVLDRLASQAQAAAPAPENDEKQA